ncbi:MAG TPA: hypothetical protein VJ484_03105, partial [Lysobacter sp.]|nr:hypothetical protein [Lysobacter sp.]
MSRKLAVALLPALLSAALLSTTTFAAEPKAEKKETPTPKPMQARSMQEILDASQASDWRPLDPANTLYLDLASGRVVIELAADFA